MAWRDRAACIDLDPNMFFPEDWADEQTLPAKRVCGGCPVLWDCLDYAVRTGQDGLWGGTSEIRRRAPLVALRTGNMLLYHQALAAEVENLGRVVAGHPDERPLVPPHPCGRCGALIKEGRHPPDMNGPDARCGLAATYNKGCRCLRCVRGKALRHERTKERRQRGDTPEK